MNIQEARNKIEQEKGKKQEVETRISELRTTIRKNMIDLRNTEKAREIIRIVGLNTQQQLQYHISDIASLALESIFPNPYKLILKFIERRNKTECDIVFELDGEEYSPLDDTGVGVVDVASFALRIACWSMMIGKINNTIILDEPFKHLSVNYQENASAMIKELSERLGIQFIIVTHEQNLTMSADKIFEVKLRKGVSKILT
jgi:ABC-type arginine transport system ATPase subunit